MTSFCVAVDASNPAEFLGVCGLIELAGQRDRNVTASWTRRQGMIAEAKSAASDVCEICTILDESAFATELAALLGDQSAWTAITDSGRVTLSDAVGRWVAGIELNRSDRSVIAVIDHWYERAFVKDNRIVQRPSKSRDGKGRWKFWAGHHDAKGIAALLVELVNAMATMPSPTCLQDLFRYVTRGGSGLKLDPSTMRSALDRGTSANDAAGEGDSVVRPALELLATIGASTFFPPRRNGDAAPSGTVGIHARQFHFATWNQAASLSLARLLARGVNVAGFNTELRQAQIGMMGQYSYFRYARPAGLAESGGRTDLLDDEDTDE